MWKIGNIEIKNRVAMAPMAGISNPSYIKICAEMGAGYAITELISAEAIVRNNKKTLDMLNGIDKINIPVAVQLFGSKADKMAKAAQIITGLYKNVFIDINMGCPVPKVAVKNEAGSALLKSPAKVAQIVSTIQKSISVPVTVKIRSGWDNEHINAVEVAQICEKAGASAIAVHPRTRTQGYTGSANWDIIKQVKENVTIPVIGNGDIKTVMDAKKMLDETGCDAIMIGRGLLGNPWLIEDIINYLENGIFPKVITKDEKIDMIEKHYNYLIKEKDERISLLEMRMFIPWYLKGLKNNSIVKNKIFSCKSFEEIRIVLNEYRKEDEND